MPELDEVPQEARGGEGGRLGLVEPRNGQQNHAVVDDGEAEHQGRSRVGLDDALPESRAAIAQRLGVSTEWVRQLEYAALARLKKDPMIQTAFSDHLGGATQEYLP